VNFLQVLKEMNYFVQKEFFHFELIFQVLISFKIGIRV